jgi:hypothetical protein
VFSFSDDSVLKLLTQSSDMRESASPIIASIAEYVASLAY